MANTELYDILEIKVDATEDEIKKAYRKLTKKYHPDLHPNDEENNNKYKKINEAYSVLSDKTKRDNYDNGFDPNNTNNGFNNDFFNMVNHMRSQNRNPYQQGDNIILDCSINVKSAYKGTKMNVKYNRSIICSDCKGKGYGKDGSVKKCPDCNGTGVITRNTNNYGNMQSISMFTCPRCNGTGTIITNPCKKCKGKKTTLKEEKFKFDIPAGTVSGEGLLYSGMGNTGLNGMPNGDLIIRVNVTPFENYLIAEPRSNNLLYNLHIDYTQAILGDIINIKGLDNEMIPITINRKMKQNTIVIPNKGLPSKQLGKGALLIVITIDFPKELSKEEEKLLLEIRKLKK